MKFRIKLSLYVILFFALALRALNGYAATNTILTKGTPPNIGNVAAKDTSVGAGDAAKVPLLNTSGLVDWTMLSTSGACDSTAFLRGDNTCSNWISGALGLGTSSLTGYGLHNSTSLSATSPFGEAVDGTIQSTATGTTASFYSSPSTAPTAFTANSLVDFWAKQGTIGAGSTLSFHYAFLADSSNTGATNNYGFYSNLPSQSNTFNFYANGTAPNYFAGKVGIGSNNLAAGIEVQDSLNVTGATTGIGLQSSGTFQSDVTSAGYSFLAVPATQATSYTLSNIREFGCSNTAAGSGSTITTQTCFYVPTLSSGTNNYALDLNVASGTNNYNIHAGGTAQNLLTGNTGIGTAPVTTSALRVAISAETSGTSIIGYELTGSAQSNATSTVYGFNSTMGTQATSYTLTNMRHFYAQQGTIGAGSTLTNQYGFYAESGLTGATNNYGFYCNIAVSGTARYCFYGNGTAPSYLGGNLGIGQTNPTAYLHIKAGTTAASTAPIKLTSGSLMTTAEAGGIEFLTDKVYATITTGAARKEFTLNDSSLTSGTVPVATTNGRLQNGTTATFVGSGITSVVTTVSSTAQAADITSTNFTGANVAGLYRVSYALEDTTADATAGAVTLTIAYTDTAGSATQASAAQLLTGAGRTQGSVFVQLNSGSISYSTAHTGIFATAKYALYMTVERMQ